MEKRNTILLTVIAVATLLVAVVGATFAYFAQSGDYNGTANLTANTAGASSEFIAVGSDITLQVTAANMVEAQKGNQVTTQTVNDAINVKFKAGTTERLSCTYQLYYQWNGGDEYTMTQGADGNKEFTYTISKVTDTAATADTGYTESVVAETNFVASNTSGMTNVGTVQTIANESTTTETVDHYQITVKFYNLALDQSADKAGKTWNLKFGVTNVVC